MSRGSWTRRLLVAGVVVHFATRAASEEAVAWAPEEPDTPPPAARAPRRTRRRVAISLAYTTLFFAGAALTAGAGNIVAHIDDGSTVAAEATDNATTDTTTTAADATADTAASDATDAAAAPAVESPALAPAAAPEPAAAPDPAPAADDAPATAPSADPVAAPSAAAPAAEPSDVTQSKPTSSPVSAAAPATEAAPAQQAKRKVTRKTLHVQPHRELARLPIPFQAIAFDPQAWLHNNPASPTGASAVAIAMHYLGVPYRWGGAVPQTGFDCSGLVRFVYGQLGVSLVHYAATQFSSFPKLDPAQLQPGDLVFFEPKMDGPGHVAMYIGNDQIIEAPHTGALVRINSLSGEAAALGFLGAVRPYGPQQADRILMSVAPSVAPAAPELAATLHAEPM